MTGRQIMWAARGLAGLLLSPLLVAVLNGAPVLDGASGHTLRFALFYAVTIMLFLALPKLRRTDVASVLVMLVCCVEAVASCGLHRTLDTALPLAAASVSGVVAATLPAAVERFRYAARRRGWSPLKATR
jgi:hypothetical protein